MASDNPKLKILANGAQVIVTIESKTLDRRFEFSFYALADWAARLLASQLRDQLYATMQQIREDAYNEGWRDAKAKRTKRRFFDGLLP